MASEAAAEARADDQDEGIDPRDAAARAICDGPTSGPYEKPWDSKKNGPCPEADHLRKELRRRLNNTKQYTSFNWQRLANELKLLPPYKKSSSSAVAAASTSQVSIRLECSLCESYSSSYFCSVISSHQVSSTSSAQNWHPKTDGARLIMCLIILREEFLLRNGTLTRLELEHDRKAFWTLVEKLFNSTNEELNELVGSPELLERYRLLGISSEPTGYVVTAEKCEFEFKSIRSTHTKAQANFLQSGMGDDGKSIRDHVEEDEDYAVTIFAADFKSFVKLHPINEFFYNALISHNLLASAAVDMPAGAKSSSSRPGVPTSSLVKRTKRRSTSSGSDVDDKLLKEVTLSPDSKAQEKRTRISMAELAEGKAKRARILGKRKELKYIKDLESSITEIKDELEGAGCVGDRREKLRKRLKKQEKELNELEESEDEEGEAEGEKEVSDEDNLEQASEDSLKDIIA